MKRRFSELFPMLLLFGLGQPLLAQTGYNFTTLAGWPGVTGSADGAVGIVRFATPTGMAIDSAGNFYVADSASDTIRKASPNGTVVSTIAGMKGIDGSQDGPAAQAQFNGPLGVAVDQTGDIYVADTGNDTVRKITPGGIVSTLAGTPGVVGSGDGMGAAAQFRNPGGIAVDASGNVYVADTGNNTVRMITPAGMVTTLAGTAGQTGSGDGLGPAAQFSAPNGVAVGTAGVYVSDSGNDAIRLIAPTGMVTTFATGLSAPEAVTVDSAGNIDVVTTSARFAPYEGYGQSICQITPGGVVGTLAALTPTIQTYSSQTPAAGVAVDASGNIYATDPGSGMIRKIVPGTGAVTLFVGTDEAVGPPTFRMATAGTSLDGTVGTARFNSPGGLTLDGMENLYVADSANNTIRKITPAGIVSTIAGTPGQAGNTDGPGTSAQFNGPTGIAVDAAGNLYVADTGNYTVRKISPTGVVSTLARLGGQMVGVAVDGAGNVYTADTANDTVLKISPTGSFSTLAGIANQQGKLDGPAGSALFNAPTVVAVDGAGNVYAYDSGDHEIRRINPTGMVDTLAGGQGLPSVAGLYPGPPADGIGSAAGFGDVLGIAADAAGNLYVADSNEVREITPSGMVSTLAGSFGAAATGFGIAAPRVIVTGNTDGLGRGALFNAPAGIAVDGAGNLYVADTGNDAIRLGYLNDTQAIAQPPNSQTIASGHTVVFSALAFGAPGSTYQWAAITSNIHGGDLAGATDSILVIPSVSAADAGTYICYVSNSNGTTVSTNSFTLNVTTTSDPGYLLNLSARGNVGTGNNILIGGFSIGGAGSKQLLVRGAGPALASALSGELVTPQLALLDNNGLVIASNMGWANAPAPGPSAASYSPQAAGSSIMAAVGAFSYAAASADTAMLVTAPTGKGTAEVTGIGGTTGIALVEFYDADAGAPASRLINISARADVGTGNDILIGGFVVGGTTAETVLIRAVGPGLIDNNSGLSDTLAQPVLTLFSGGAPLYSNTGWGGDPAIANAFTTVGAFPLNPAHADSALLVTLPPGDYTAEVSGLNGGAGIALCEIYEVP